MYQPLSSVSSFPPTHTWFKLPAHSAAFIDKAALLEDGDKIILPPSVLQNLLLRFRERLPHPLIFEVNNNAVQRSSHCGVLEFSAPDDCAYLPQWMMENLEADEGREVRLRVKALPKALEVRLQPVEWAFADLPTPKESLEHALRNFTALTVGDLLRIRHGAAVYHLKVNALQPVTTSPAAASVVNTSVAVEFEEPIEQPRKGERVEEVKEGDAVDGRVEAEAYHYYRFRLDDRALAVRVQCTPPAGQAAPDVYVSTVSSKPSLASQQWKTSLAQPTIALLPTDAAFASAPSSWFYLAVHAYKQPAQYTLLLTTFAPPQSSSSMPHLNGHTTSSSTSSSSPPLSSATPSSGMLLGSSAASAPVADSTFCSNCRLPIPNRQYHMHSIQCPRVNVWCDGCGRVIRRSEAASHSHCPTCNAVVHPDELSKHIDLLHSSLRCAQCEAHVAAEDMAAHLAERCPMRLLSCHYCSMQLPAKDLPEHLSYEAARSVQCHLCDAHVPRKKLNIHLAAVHSINPSLRPGDRSSMGRAIASASSSAGASASSSIVSSTASSIASSARTSLRGEDEDIARVLRESRRAAGLPEEDDAEDDEAQLQRVLRQSALEAETKDGEATNGSVSPRALSDQLTAEDDAPAFLGAGEGEGDEDVVGMNDDADDDWGDETVEADASTVGDGAIALAPAASASAPSTNGSNDSTAHGRRSERSMCPYCHTEVDNYDLLIAHMESCEFMED